MAKPLTFGPSGALTSRPFLVVTSTRQPAFTAPYICYYLLMSKLLKAYQALVKQGGVQEDPQQLEVINTLDHIGHALAHPRKRRWFRKAEPIKGLYMWGSVGIGKTFLMDLFYQEVVCEKKMRIHFHAFMRQVQQRLFELQGAADPLITVAEEIANKAKLLCLDEFIVDDISNAMILYQLLEALLQFEVVIITSANTEPDRLYEGGLQRERFLPAIELIKKNFTVIHLTTRQDYRREFLEKEGTYYTPIDAHTDQLIAQSFSILAKGEVQKNTQITVQSRTMEVLGLAEELAWFEFNVLCVEKRSQNDYLELSQRFKTILIAKVPLISETDIIRRFILLVDVFYDAKVKLIIQAQALPENLYSGERWQKDYKRTMSRLAEMRGW